MTHTIPVTDNGIKLHVDARRKFKAAVYVVSLVNSVVIHPRVVGKKSRRATSLSGRDVMSTLARRKFRAAVFAVIATHELQKRRAELYPLYVLYGYGYEEPVYEWERTAVPVVTKYKFTREVSLEVEDLFATEEDYLRKLATLQYGSVREKIQEVLKRRYQLQAVALALMAAKELNRALDMNMHPSNKYQGLEYALAVLPNVNAVLKSQEVHHKVHFQLAMRQKLRAAIYAAIAVQRLVELQQAKGKAKAVLQFRAAVYAVIAVNRLIALQQATVKSEASKASNEWKALMQRHRHDVLELRVREKLGWLGEHIPPRHPRHQEMMAMAAETQEERNSPQEERNSGMTKFNWAVDTVLKASE